MADQILIRNLPDSLKPALRSRAAAHGRSVEAEARAILVDAVQSEDPVRSWLEGLARIGPGQPLPTPARVPGRDLPAFE